jgi:putative hemolysin
VLQRDCILTKGVPILLTKGRYHARAAASDQDMVATLALRDRCFGASGALPDKFDDSCIHIMVFDTKQEQLVCCFRMLTLQPTSVSGSYSAQFYDLSALENYAGTMVELGRFCVDPDLNDPDILRLAWAELTAYVDANSVRMLFGCSSFAGIDVTPYTDAFALLKARHLAPEPWVPQIKAPDVFRYADDLREKPDLKKAMRAMPPLLRTYLMMGGWVSDHAVVDPLMNTLHVFTGLEIGAIPPARKRLLRALVG